jgi:electron transport complex protein RnfC
MIACYEAVEKNLPLTEIVMTVSGNGIKTPKNLKVALGTPFSDIASYCGGISDNAVKLIAGGPMMGKALISLNHYTRITDSGFLVLDDKETSTASPTNCINCAMCARNCPMRLMPMYIESYTLAGDYKNAEKYGAMSCLECGSCAFNCPAKRPLVQSISYAKSKIKEMKTNGR